MGYGYEFSSTTIAVEAIAMGCCCYDSLHKYLDEPVYTKPSSSPCTDPLEILNKIAVDKRFDGLFQSAGENDIAKLFAEREDAVLEYWNAWDLSNNPQQQLEESQRLAASLLVGTREDGKDYDFFLAHVLTSSHAIRILVPLVPAKFQVPLIRQWWLVVIGVYIMQLRPRVDTSSIANFDLDGRDWKYVQGRALEDEHAVNAHYVKALRALKEGAATWGDEKEYFLKAAVKFAAEFNGWGGFLRE
jgi:Questin oxidase-like